MNFLYGDSTKSPLKSNFLEFLRDSLDFASAVLQAEDRISQGAKRVYTLNAEAEAETRRLETFVATVTKAMADAPKGSPESATAKCAAQMMAMADRALRNSVEAVKAKLVADTEAIDAEERAEREACFKALETLLIAHIPPDATTALQIELHGSAFEGSLVGGAALGLVWQMALAIPEGDLWTAPLRIERLFPTFEIRTPQLSGWISKEVKIRPEKLERHSVIEFADNGETMSFKLRSETSLETGYDVEVDLRGKAVSITRVAPAGDTTAGDFEVEEDDAGKLIELAKKLRAGTKTLERAQLLSATIDDTPFAESKTFSEFVKELVEMMAPIVREISERSLTPNELILRRMLGNDRREEIFVTKAALREKYEPLPPAHRKLFAPLGLDATPTANARAARSEPPPVEVNPPVRSELAPSRPPPPRSVPPTPVSVAPAPLPKRSFGPSAPSEPPPAVRESAAGVNGEAAHPASQPPAAEAPAPVADVAVAVAERPSTTDMSPVSAANPAKNEGATKVLAVRMKKIFALAKAGATEEAYKEYVALFTSPGFEGHRVEDQRQALRLMVHTKTPPPKTDAVLDAYRAAKSRIEMLADQSKEPGDYEMLGMCQMMLGDEGARDTFHTALNLERARNPTSDLVGKLMRRITTV